jgi:hypothetical protein
MVTSVMVVPHWPQSYQSGGQHDPTLQQLLDPFHGLLPTHVLLDGKAFEGVNCGIGVCCVFRYLLR